MEQPSPIENATPQQIKESKVRQAAGAFGAISEANKLTIEEFLFAIMLSLVPILTHYPRDVERKFLKHLDKELRLQRRKKLNDKPVEVPPLSQ